MEPFWKKRQQQDADNERTDLSHPHKRMDAIDNAIAGLKEAVDPLKNFIGNWREKLETLWKERENTMVDLTVLTAAVTANTAAVQAATAAIQNLSTNSVDPTALASLTSTLQSNNSTLEAAVAAAAPPPATGATAPATPPAT
jgi:hypothetical protein